MAKCQINIPDVNIKIWDSGSGEEKEGRFEKINVRETAVIIIFFFFKSLILKDSKGRITNNKIIIRGIYTNAWFCFILLSEVKCSNFCLYLADVVWTRRTTHHPGQKSPSARINVLDL